MKDLFENIGNCLRCGQAIRANQIVQTVLKLDGTIGAEHFDPTCAEVAKLGLRKKRELAVAA